MATPRIFVFHSRAQNAGKCRKNRWKNRWNDAWKMFLFLIHLLPRVLVRIPQILSLRNGDTKHESQFNFKIALVWNSWIL